jgi:hypothetical protein
MKSGVFHVSVLEDGKIQFSHCSCGASYRCDHFYVAVSGKTKLLSEEGMATQKQLISSLSQSDEGKRLIFVSQPIAKRLQSSWLRNKLRKQRQKLLLTLREWLIADL